MLNLLLIVFVFAALTVILVLSIVGAIFFRKKSNQPSQRIDPANVIDVTPKDVK